ncbi:aldolase catalytic domain-containing protein [Clostridiaceae bacterium UIB06]|uniref:Aldolase catalytic domain-containing protein n=1 Tax=Clostridium thailandense TaxID=2794346 RepID=A0A949TXP3_9CLOT|nr:aldolase catalytic domain-containing protein [Clostridium thailandense]MBV7272803.1 aldolase catalytic domain-containing protein [Clostridium thailandense]MCH5137656.1 aldolase catalytic domain-containing protein [Clostridiaceae bacterium UIB06]
MSKLKLLDCTLRDGGYLNDWEFGHDTMTSILERLVSSGIDVIEVGFLDERRDFDINRSIMPDTASVKRIYGNIDKGNAMVVGMIDYGTCSIEHIQPCNEGYLDGIRVIFKKHIMHEAINFCKQIKTLGYKVFTQAVSITSYNDEELLELIGLVNDLEPYAISMVDTYGLLHQDNLIHIFDIMDTNLNPQICLGYHAHNNFQMGYANCIEVLNKNVNRTILVDGTLYGMGKSAGNTPIELISMYMNENFEKSYDINQMLEAIEINIIEIYNKIPWGYNLFYYISAANKCHPNYVSYLLNKRTLSIKSINEILKCIDKEKKLLYNKNYIEALYLDYQRNECDDTDAIKALEIELRDRLVLLIGPGKSIASDVDKIKNYINAQNPIIISINYICSAYTPQYLFITNSKRYVQMATKLSEDNYRTLKTIATSNVTKTNGSFSYVLNYSSLIDKETEIPDNSFIMLLKALEKAGVKNIGFAGFDGYSESEMNYFNTNMEYSFAKEKAQYLNNYAKIFLSDYKKRINVEFVTSSYYEI